MGLFVRKSVTNNNHCDEKLFGGEFYFQNRSTLSEIWQVGFFIQGAFKIAF
jgi:hypothetical protein